MRCARIAPYLGANLAISRAIAKAISIVNDGAATIGSSSGNAGASDCAHLRGLTIEGHRTGANGILFNTGGNLAIENCVVRGVHQCRDQYLARHVE